jgi:hypothetical protein
MSANTTPIFTGTPAVGNPVVLITAANDVTGFSPYNVMCFQAGAFGAYIQKIRFKSLGACTASAARVYINLANSHLASLLGTPATPTCTPSSSGGTMLTGTYYYKIVAVDSTGSLSVASVESSGASVTGPTGSNAIAWTATSGASSYRIYVGTASGTESNYFTSNTNSYTQIAMAEASTSTAVQGAVIQTLNQFYDEIALPTTTASAVSGTPTCELPMNIAIPANASIYVGLGTTVSAGWAVSVIGGNY